MSLYPWDKCLIPQGVKGKINHPGEISQPADLAGERQREIGCLTDWLGPPLRGGKMLALRLQMGNILASDSRPCHLGKSLLTRFWRRWLSPLPVAPALPSCRSKLLVCLPSGPMPAGHPALSGQEFSMHFSSYRGSHREPETQKMFSREDLERGEGSRRPGCPMF